MKPDRKLRILLYADSYNDRVGQSTSYLDFFSNFGEVVLVTASSDLPHLIHHCDVLALPGGADVNPMRYGEFPEWHTGRTNPNYEYMDWKLLDPWLETGKPIIGICRGLQTLNVACGGSLIQHITGHVGGEDRTRGLHDLYTGGTIDGKTVEGIRIPNEGKKGSKDYTLHKVNSFHHQCIKELAPGFDIIGWAPVFKGCPSTVKPSKNFLREGETWTRNKQGMLESEGSEWYCIPEIIRHRERPWIAFQYHPEDFNCPLAIYLIEKTLSSYYK